MSKETTLVLIPRFTTLSGTDDSPTTYTTQPKDVSALAYADFLLVRGPIVTANPLRAHCRVTLEESPDRTNWIRCAGGQEHPCPNGEHVDAFHHPFRFQWLRARVELEGESVSCSLEGEIRPHATGSQA